MEYVFLVNSLMSILIWFIIYFKNHCIEVLENRLKLSDKYIRRLKASAKMRGVDLEDVFDDRNE